jgi:hypothetical protein
MATFSQPNPVPQPVPVPHDAAAQTGDQTGDQTGKQGSDQGGDQPGDQAGEPSLKPRVSFFQQPWVQKALPFTTSLVLHLSIILVVVIFFKVAPSVLKAVKEQIIVPDAQMVNDAPVGGITNPGLGGDPNRASAQDKVADADASGLNDKKTENLSQSLMSGGGNDGAADNVIGLGAHAGIGAGSGIGAAMGGSSGTGSGEGQLSPFGVPGGGGGVGPKSPFMGISGNGRKIVYLVDASGSMLSVFPRVKQELMISVSHLQPIQAFNIIVFHEDESDMATMSKGGLLMANPDNKIAAGKFTDDQRAMAGTDPIPAIKLAFQQKPDLIYVLTDGFDNVDSFQAIIDLFHNLNVNKAAKVNAIMLKSRDDPALEHVLQAITDDAGGTFKVINESDL